MERKSNNVKNIRQFRIIFPLYVNVILPVGLVEYHHNNGWCLPICESYGYFGLAELFEDEADNITVLEKDISTLSIRIWLEKNRHLNDEWPKCIYVDCDHWDVEPVLQKYNEKMRCLRRLPLPIANEIGEYLIP